MSKQKTTRETVGMEPEDQPGLPDANDQTLDDPLASLDEIPSTEALIAQVSGLESDLEEQKEKHLRLAAEIENTRRRADNDVSNARKFAVESFASEVLSVRDSLQLAMATDISGENSDMVEKVTIGLDLTLKQLDAVFGKFGISEIDPAPGDKLDPEKHQAMTLQETPDIAPNHIVSVVQKGYSIHDRLLRPAMVIVAKPPSANESTAG